MENANLGFDLVKIIKTFELTEADDCQHLTDWLATRFELNTFELQVLEDIYTDISVSGEYMNEEELRTRLVGLLFYLAKIEIPKKVRVFYERKISSHVKNIPLSVICDCIVATPVAKTPDVPYFFLQEFKKSKGEKKDPEAQMLIAMLIAQQENPREIPLYGGYMIGTGWHFATLIGKSYCVSRKLELTQKENLIAVVSILRQLKDLIMNNIENI